MFVACYLWNWNDTTTRHCFERWELVNLHCLGIEIYEHILVGTPWLSRNKNKIEQKVFHCRYITGIHCIVFAQSTNTPLYCPYNHLMVLRMATD